VHAPVMPVGNALGKGVKALTQLRPMHEA
jgi:hypothetical protein